MKSYTVFTALLVAAVTTEALEAENNAASGLLRTTARGQEDATRDTTTSYQINNRELRPVTFFANPTTEGSWGHCEGDCDIDDDCYHNLICFHRQENAATQVPGCKGGDQDFTATDYCVFPGDIPLSGNLFEEHTGDHLNDEATSSGGTPDDLNDRTNNTIISVADPDGDTATDAPLSLVQASGVSSLSHNLALAGVVSAAMLVFGA